MTSMSTIMEDQFVEALSDLDEIIKVASQCLHDKGAVYNPNIIRAWHRLSAKVRKAMVALAS